MRSPKTEFRLLENGEMDDNGFQNHLQSIGAEFLDTAGNAPTARHFGDPTSEYHAAQTGAILVDLSDRTQIEMTGDDRVTGIGSQPNIDSNEQRCAAVRRGSCKRVVAAASPFCGAFVLPADGSSASPPCQQ